MGVAAGGGAETGASVTEEAEAASEVAVTGEAGVGSEAVAETERGAASLRSHLFVLTLSLFELFNFTHN